MVIYRFPPQEGDSEGQSEKQFEGKPPDFIYIDDDRQTNAEAKGSFNRKQAFTSTKIVNGSYPGFFRVLTLVVAAALTVWIGVLLAIFLVTGVIAAVLLFQETPALLLARKLWKTVCRLSAYALGLFVATLNPSFGFGILALYAVQHGENWEQGAFGRMFTQYEK